eukprot:TRINITY_DN15119_c0_g1_i1.p1 TRINITY_DN15119_c0_g1~~TRINITY_DN15119_c0_g1_i1.p1  ORF type:complete len:307 (-),score=27.26 TRINITY_DN15119_c0_g1_i1:145-1065(-)
MASTKKEPSKIERYFFTGLSATVAEACTFPIDITKTRLQIQGELVRLHAAEKRGALSTAALIVREEGVRGIFRGLSPAVARHWVYSPIRIVMYEQLRHGLAEVDADGKPRPLSIWRAMAAGATSGAIGQLVASPTDLIKVRMQADGRLVKQGHPARYTGIFDALVKVSRQEGLGGLWRGWLPNVQRAALVNLGELATYDTSKRAILGSGVVGDNIWCHTLASIVSGFVSAIVSTPADVVKTRLMNQQAGASLYSGSLDCLVKSVRAEGVLALWKGFLPTWARQGPWQLVFWVTYEQMRKFVGATGF